MMAGTTKVRRRRDRINEKAKYPFRLVKKARAMREERRMSYREIAEAIAAEDGATVAIMTVRDWTNYYIRMLR